MAALDQEPAEDAGVEGFLQLVLTRTPGSPEGPGGSGPDVVELGTQEYMMLTEPTAPPGGPGQAGGVEDPWKGLAD